MNRPLYSTIAVSLLFAINANSQPRGVAVGAPSGPGAIPENNIGAPVTNPAFSHQPTSKRHPSSEAESPRGLSQGPVESEIGSAPENDATTGSRRRNVLRGEYDTKRDLGAEPANEEWRRARE